MSASILPAAGQPGRPLIDLRGVTKVYDMGQTQVHALRGIDLQVHQGEFVAIIGQSGSGKSTLMHLIGCLDTPTDGQVLIAGEDVSTYSEKELAIIRNTTVGFMFQTFNLLSRISLLRNTNLPLTYAGVPARHRRRRGRAILDELGLGDRLRHNPNELSGGQRQRAAMARALITDPALILADEPTGNLDSESGAHILELLEQLHQKGRTIILVTHEARIADAAERQVRLLDGRIVEDTGSSDFHPSLPQEADPMTATSVPDSNPADTPQEMAPPPRRRRQGKLRRIVKWVVVLLVLAGIGGCVGGLIASRSEPEEGPLKDSIRLERGAVAERLLETGTVELRTTIEVKSTMSGKVKELLAEEGDAVEKDQVLAVIEPDPNEILRLYQKRAAVESRWIELRERSRERERSQLLFERGVTPGDQNEKTEDAWRSAQTSYQLARLELEALESEIDPEATGSSLPEGPVGEAHDPTNSILNTLTDIRVRSPLTGLVIKRPAEVGELVISGTATTISGTTLMELGDPADAVIRASVNEVDIGKIKVGQRVEVTLSAYKDRPLAARVARISPIGVQAQGQSVVSFAVEVALEERDAVVMPGMTCDLDLVIEEKADALFLPRNALFQEVEKSEADAGKKEEEEKKKGGLFGNNRWEDEKPEEEKTYLDYVWLKTEEDWEKREVTIGLKGDKRAEIATGLAEEDEVYPEAERMSWIMKERERKANEKGKWPWSKKEKGESKSDGEDDASS
jgi:putative ABC transport system ATP-binding protein